MNRTFEFKSMKTFAAPRLVICLVISMTQSLEALRLVSSNMDGLRLNPEPHDVDSQSASMFTMGTNEPLRTSKRSNDMLDEYISNYEKMQFSRHDASEKSISIIESDGFFDEPDGLWAARKQRHINQMHMQDILMTTCPDEFLPSAKTCLEGCVGKKADCVGNIFWQTHYEPSFSCLLEERVGAQGEGGKWICDPNKIQAQENCLVYSIGSNGQYDFEEHVHNHISSKCEIHTIDMNPWQTYTKNAPPEYVTYHVNTIGPKPHTPIDKLVKTLGHTDREIDIFKIDCEGCEWKTYKSWFGKGVRIRQVLVEIHGTGGGHKAHEFFNTLFDMGYVVFHKEPNTLGCGGECVEYAFVRLDPKFTRATNASLS